jgi:hypothetical protein
MPQSVIIRDYLTNLVLVLFQVCSLSIFVLFQAFIAVYPLCFILGDNCFLLTKLCTESSRDGLSLEYAIGFINLDVNIVLSLTYAMCG